MIALSLLLPSVLLLLSLPLITIIVLHHYHCYWHRIHYECHHHHQHHHHHHDHHHHHHHHHHQPCLQQAPGSMNEIQTSTNRYPKDPNTYAEIPAIDQRTNQNARQDIYANLCRTARHLLSQQQNILPTGSRPQTSNRHQKQCFRYINKWNGWQQPPTKMCRFTKEDHRHLFEKPSLSSNGDIARLLKTINSKTQPASTDIIHTVSATKWRLNWDHIFKILHWGTINKNTHTHNSFNPAPPVCRT